MTIERPGRTLPANGLITAATAIALLAALLAAPHAAFASDPGPEDADLNGDGAVGPQDLAILLEWFQVDNSGDVNGDQQTDDQDLALLLAFWGADMSQRPEGLGAVTSGGAGGEIYVVTNLNSSGPGSFAAGVLSRNYDSHGAIIPREIEFAVGGEIYISGELEIRLGRLTIEGATAPSPGITICKTHPNSALVLRDVSDVILSHVRFLGLGTIDGNDNLSLRGAHRAVVDHVTSSQADDAAIDIAWNGNTDVTISWCLLHSSHTGMTISYGPNARLSLHHNVWGLNGERNPQLRYENAAVDFVNNVVYGWGGGGYGVRIRAPEPGAGYGDGISEANIINNAFVPGAAPGINALIFGDRAGSNDDGGPPNPYPQGTVWTTANGSRMGTIHVAGNLLPPQNLDHYSTVAAPLPIPAEAAVTTWFADELSMRVLPFAGWSFRTSAEQALINQIDAAFP